MQGELERAVAREICLQNTNQALGSTHRVIVIFLFLLFFFSCFCSEKSKLKRLQGHLCQVAFVKLKAVWSRKAVLPAAKKMQRSRVSRESESSLKVLRRPVHPSHFRTEYRARLDPETQGEVFLQMLKSYRSAWRPP